MKRVDNTLSPEAEQREIILREEDRTTNGPGRAPRHSHSDSVYERIEQGANPGRHERQPMDAQLTM